MIRHLRRLALLALGLAAWSAQAEVRAFTAASLKQIESARQGRPFILSLWSAGCTHCPAELRSLGELARRNPRLEIVLVAADTPADAPELESLAADYGLARQAQWVFADPQPERLRQAIDRRWFGELPRTYFYDARHHRTARSGVVPAAELERWVAEHVK